MRRISSRFLCLAVLVFLAEASLSWAQKSNVVVITSTKHVLAPALSKRTSVSAVTQRLGSLAVEPGKGLITRFEDEEEMSRREREEAEYRVLDRGVPMNWSPIAAPDAVRQESVTSATLSTTPGENFIGVGNGANPCPNNFVSPDPNGAVGPTQFVQWVNFCFAVFNKSTGALEFGPAASNSLWTSLGGPCATNDNFDTSAQYDKLAGRWVMFMPVTAEPTTLCVAVSTTSDAVNTQWNLYSFPVPSREDPDYPKLGVWPDAYYVSYNQFGSNGFVGPAACALDRTNMLAGNTAAAMQCFTKIGAVYGALLPSDVDGTTPPPVGTPNYFLNFDSNYQSLDLWQFSVNWTNPSLTTFTGPTNIPVAAFAGPCGDIPIINLQSAGGACIPQKGTTTVLNSYGDRLMYRLAYRNLGSHQSLLVNHAVNPGVSGVISGIRWYELQNTGSGFTLFQQGTYAPDSNSRWMGSIAMDKAGDIALGYSVTSSSMSPSIRYTGRVPTDPLGTMEGEYDMLTSQGITPGSETGRNNWGDYSSMAIDPTDDCTFWYTAEYVPTTGGRWTSRVASFTFPNCTNTTPPSWTLVNKASAGGPSATSLTIPATGSGNLVAFAVLFNGTTSVSSVTDNAGNTYVSAGARISLSNFSLEIWYAVNSKSGATVITPTFAGATTFADMSEWEVSGLSTRDVAATSTGTVTSNTLGAPVTTTATGDFVVSVVFAGGASFSGISSGNAFTNDFLTGGNGWAHLTSNSTGPGIEQASWSCAKPAGKYLSSTVAFLPNP